MHGAAPSVETLNGLRYLDMFIREVMRLHCPVTSTQRVAMKDDIIPTDHEWTDVYGAKRSGVPYV